MSCIQDDPRDVLTFLNSLGFVGITAPQLKLFMKDLKLYRKIKQKEQQEWKDKAKAKLRSRQKSLNEILRPRNSESQSSEYISSGSVTSRETSSVKIRYKYSSKDKENRQRRFSNSEDHRSVESSSDYPSNKNEQVRLNERVKLQKQSTESNVLEEFSKLSVRQVPVKIPIKIKPRCLNDEDKIEKVDEVCQTNVNDSPKTSRSSRRRTRSAATDSARTRDTQRSSSRSKSFIRPWKLQTESQQSLISKKSDPVALYHKYHQEWKQLSLPGEDRHSKLRWEIREKMLGTDPVPRPTIQKSASLATLRRKCF